MASTTQNPPLQTDQLTAELTERIMRDLHRAGYTISKRRLAWPSFRKTR